MRPCPILMGMTRSSEYNQDFSHFFLIQLDAYNTQMTRITHTVGEVFPHNHRSLQDSMAVMSVDRVWSLAHEQGPRH